MTSASQTPEPDGAVANNGASRAHRVLLWLAGLALALGLLAVLMGPALYRLHVLPLDAASVGVARMAAADLGAALLLALGGLALSIWRRDSRGVILGIVLGTAAMLGGFRALGFTLSQNDLPPLWDAQTDWTNPVRPGPAGMAERQADGAVAIADELYIPAGQSRWGGKSAAEAEAEVYGLKPLLVAAPPAEAKLAVFESMRRLGWVIRTEGAPDDQVEAVHKSLWYGLKSDIVARISPQGTGSRIDVRSTSRIAAPDMGANARRVETLLNDVAFALRAEGEESRGP